MYVPNRVKVYGSNNDDIEIPATYAKYYYKRMIMTKTHLKSLNQPSEPCSSDKNAADTSICIAKYIEEKLGCNPLILGSHPRQLTCNSSSQWEMAVALNKKFQRQAGVYKLWKPASTILDWRTWSKFRERREHGEHGKDGKHGDVLRFNRRLPKEKSKLTFVDVRILDIHCMFVEGKPRTVFSLQTLYLQH